MFLNLKFLSSQVFRVRLSRLLSHCFRLLHSESSFFLHCYQSLHNASTLLIETQWLLPGLSLPAEICLWSDGMPGRISRRRSCPGHYPDAPISKPLNITAQPPPECQGESDMSAKKNYNILCSGRSPTLLAIIETSRGSTLLPSTSPFESLPPTPLRDPERSPEVGALIPRQAEGEGPELLGGRRALLQCSPTAPRTDSMSFAES